jgi:hypothetical protein
MYSVKMKGQLKLPGDFLTASLLVLRLGGYPFSESTVPCGRHIIGSFLGYPKPDIQYLRLEIFSSTGPTGSPLEVKN